MAEDVHLARRQRHRRGGAVGVVGRADPGEAVGQGAELFLQCRVVDRLCDASQLGMHVANLLRVGAARRGHLGRGGVEQCHPAVHLVADRDLVRQAAAGLHHDVRDAVAQPDAFADRRVHDGAGITAHHDRHREHRAQALREDRTVVVVGDGAGTAVVVDGRGIAAGDHVPAEA